VTFAEIDAKRKSRKISNQKNPNLVPFAEIDAKPKSRANLQIKKKKIE
jgi:hypothetical protein